MLLKASLKPTAASPPLNMDFALSSLTPRTVRKSGVVEGEVSSTLSAATSIETDGGGIVAECMSDLVTEAELCSEEDGSKSSLDCNAEMRQESIEFARFDLAIELDVLETDQSVPAIGFI